MWNFLAREANWTEIVTNTLALSFSFMAIAIIIHAAIFSENPDMLATAGSVSSGVTGVILGYYFKPLQAEARARTRNRGRPPISAIHIWQPRLPRKSCWKSRWSMLV